MTVSLKKLEALDGMKFKLPQLCTTAIPILLAGLSRLSQFGESLCAGKLTITVWWAFPLSVSVSGDCTSPQNTASQSLVYTTCGCEA